MKIAFSGYYGVSNSGDDAFIEVTAWGSIKYWGAKKPLFFAKEFPEIKTLSTYYHAHKNYINFSRAVKDIFLSDIFVSAGGSTFHSKLKKSDLRTYAKMKKRIGLKGKIGAIGISLGPYKNVLAEKNTIDYLRELDFLALRDTYSYELAKSYSLPYEPINAFDLAALLPDIFPKAICPKKEKKQYVIGVSVCNYESYINGDLKNENFRNLFVERLIRALSKHKEIFFRFFIFNGNPIVGDYKLTKELIVNITKNNTLDYEIIPYQPLVQNVFEKVGECDVFISTRLHAGIFAYCNSIPFFLIEYHRKCSDFLDDINQGEKYRLSDFENDPQRITSEIENILFEKKIILPTTFTTMLERARLNFTLTNKL